MNRIFHRLAAFGAFALFGAGTVRADVFYTTDTTVRASLPEGAYIGYANYNDLNHRTNPSSPTVTLASGGGFAFLSIVYNNSMVNVSGGFFGGGLVAYNNSAVNLSAGFIHDTFIAYDSSAVNVSGGSIDSGLITENDTTANISGGSIFTLYTYNRATVNISGGAISGGLNAANNSTVNVSGGAIVDGLSGLDSSIVNIRGGNFSNGLFVLDNSTFNFFGAGLTAPLTDANFGPYSAYALSGTLTDGTVINQQLLVQNGTAARFFLNPSAVPEPGSIALLVSMTAVGAGVLRRKRRK